MNYQSQGSNLHGNPLYPDIYIGSDGHMHDPYLASAHALEDPLDCGLLMEDEAAVRDFEQTLRNSPTHGRGAAGPVSDEEGEAGPLPAHRLGYVYEGGRIPGDMDAFGYSPSHAMYQAMVRGDSLVDRKRMTLDSESPAKKHRRNPESPRKMQPELNKAGQRSQLVSLPSFGFTEGGMGYSRESELHAEISRQQQQQLGGQNQSGGSGQNSMVPSPRVATTLLAPGGHSVPVSHYTQSIASNGAGLKTLGGSSSVPLSLGCALDFGDQFGDMYGESFEESGAGHGAGSHGADSSRNHHGSGSSSRPRAHTSTRVRWTEDDDRSLISLIEELGQAWSVIAQRMPGRTSKQIKERWTNQLDPTISSDPWTLEDDRELVGLIRTLGHAWCEIARRMPGRTESQVKNRYHACLRKRLGPSALDEEFPLPEMHFKPKNAKSRKSTILPEIRQAAAIALQRAAAKGLQVAGPSSPSNLTKRASSASSDGSSSDTFDEAIDCVVAIPGGQASQTRKSIRPSSDSLLSAFAAPRPVPLGYSAASDLGLASPHSSESSTSSYGAIQPSRSLKLRH